MIFPSLELMNPSVFDRNCGCGHKITSKCQGGKRQMGPPRTELGTCPNLWHCVSSELVYPPKKMRSNVSCLFEKSWMYFCTPAVRCWIWAAVCRRKNTLVPNPQNQSFSQSTGSTVLYRPEAQNFVDLMRAVMGRSPRFVGSPPVGVGPAAEFILECVQKSWSTLPRRFPSDHPEAWPEIKSTGWQYQYIMRYQYIYIYSFNIIKVISWYDMRSHDGIWYGAICNAICETDLINTTKLSHVQMSIMSVHVSAHLIPALLSKHAVCWKHGWRETNFKNSKHTAKSHKGVLPCSALSFLVFSARLEAVKTLNPKSPPAARVPGDWSWETAENHLGQNLTPSSKVSMLSF